MCLGLAQLYEGDLAGAFAQFRAVATEARAAHDGFLEAGNLGHQAVALAWQGDTVAARAAAEASLEAAAEFGWLVEGLAYQALAVAALAAGDAEAARDAAAAAWEHGSFVPGFATHIRPVNAWAALAGGDLTAARRWADDAVTTATGWALVAEGLSARARVAIAQGEPEHAERDGHDALASVPEGFSYLGTWDNLECLGTLAGGAGNYREAARLFGAAHAVGERMGAVRPKVWDAELRGLGGGSS